jgi:alpha-L-fucosidase
MSYDELMAIVVNSLVRNMTNLINVGPDRHGVVPADAVAVLRRLGAFLAEYGESVYGTRGGPWQPCDGQVGYTHRGATFYVHLLPGQPEGPFTTPSVGDARVQRVYDVRTQENLPYRVSADGRVTIAHIDRKSHPQDTVLAVELDRSVVPVDIAADRVTVADDGRVEADLGRVVELTGVRIVWARVDDVHAYRVEGSADGVTWSVLADRTDNTDAERVQTLFCQGAARFVRVTADGPASVSSFEVFDRPFSLGC